MNLKGIEMLSPQERRSVSDQERRSASDLREAGPSDVFADWRLARRQTAKRRRDGRFEVEIGNAGVSSHLSEAGNDRFTTVVGG